MLGPERTMRLDEVHPFDQVCRFEPVWSPGGTLGAPGRVPARRPWVQHVDRGAFEAGRPPRLWRGIAVALGLVTPFWCLAWVALEWAIGP